MKKFGIIKVGYSCGIYGCTNEFFNCIYINGDEMNSFGFKGLYGVENEVERMLKEKGFEFTYIPTQYGQIKGDAKNWVGFLYLNQVKELIDKEF